VKYQVSHPYKTTRKIIYSSVSFNLDIFE
jgi:hypothetical protein